MQRIGEQNLQYWKHQTCSVLFWRFVFCVQKCRLYWEHFKHVLWTEEINQGIETQVLGRRGGLTHSLAWTLLEKMIYRKF